MRRLLLLAAACGHPVSPATPIAATPVPTPAPAPAGPTRIALPGAPATGVGLDAIAYDPVHHNVWIPAGSTGKVDVIDARSLKLTAIDGFATKEVERRGKKHTMGPSSAAVGDGVVFIGNRGDSSVCAFDGGSLAKRACATLDSSPDLLQYIAATKELWVTTPRDKSIRILDAATLAAKTKLPFDGEPEGTAVDEARGMFFTNLEDKDKTLVLDVKSHEVMKTWDAGCGEDGPKGLAFAGHLVVVCPDHVETLDDSGAVIGKLAVGNGLDLIDYIPARHQLVLAAGEAAVLVVASVGADGVLAAAATIPTQKGARNAVAAEDGTMFVADGPAGAILVYPPTR